LRILWVKAGKLLPVDTGGKIRSYNILRHLAHAHEVCLLSYYGGARDYDYEAAIGAELPGARTIHGASLDGGARSQMAAYLRSLIQFVPYAVGKFTHPAVRTAVAAAMQAGEFDVAVCDFLSASLNFPAALSLPTVLFQHNVETSLWQRLAAAAANPALRLAYTLEAAKMARYEKAALRRFHHIIAVSDSDRRQMLAMYPRGAISVVPTGVDTRQFVAVAPSPDHPPRIVFLGSMDWEPNIDAVQYFCREIFPSIRAKFPAAVFQIVGRNPHPSVRQLASGAVEVTGTVPSVAEYLRKATVVVVPLRIGGGTRLKIFEAMAAGKAVVSTTIGAEGLAVESGRDILLADTATAFADAASLLLGDSNLRHGYERAATALAAQYDWSNIVLQFAAVLERAGATRAAAKP
jgi:polysaccharide biosynthesis protein PslH